MHHTDLFSVRELTYFLFIIVVVVVVIIII